MLYPPRSLKNSHRQLFFFFLDNSLTGSSKTRKPYKLKLPRDRSLHYSFIWSVLFMTSMYSGWMRKLQECRCQEIWGEQRVAVGQRTEQQQQPSLVYLPTWYLLSVSLPATCPIPHPSRLCQSSYKTIRDIRRYSSPNSCNSYQFTPCLYHPRKETGSDPIHGQAGC